MTPDLQTMTAVRVEILKGISALWSSKAWEAKAALGRCIIQLNYRDLSCMPDVAEELELAHAALQGHHDTGEAAGCIARAALTVQTITNVKTVSGTVCPEINNAPLLRGA